MNVHEAIAGYRRPDPSRYPELAGYSRQQIYEGCMGGGALYLAAQMVRTLDLRPGQIVLDLGCGQGVTSMFLARRAGVRVIALDLWIPATPRYERFVRNGFGDQILPLHLDVTKELPFAEAYFDAMFCMNSLSFYGGSHEFLAHLLPYLKPGGLICVGMETLSDEFTSAQVENPPDVYHYNLPDSDIDVWEDDFLKMHTPAWWETLFRSSGLVDVLHCSELEDADILYEDMVRYQVENDQDPDDVTRTIAQIEYGREHRPRKTLFVLTARKR